MAIFFVFLALTTPSIAQDNLLDKYKATRSEDASSLRTVDTPAGDSEEVGSQQSAGGSRITRKEFEEVVEGTYKFSYRKARAETIGTADFNFIVMLHPRMQFYVPGTGRFVKGFSPGIDPALVRQKVAATLREAAKTPQSAEMSKIIRDMESLEKSKTELFPARNREYENAARKFSFTSPEGAPLPEADLARVTADYQTALSIIDRNFDARQREISIKIEKKRLELDEIEAERVSKIYTTPTETVRNMSDMLAEIHEISNEYCEKTGMAAVFDSSFSVAIPRDTRTETEKNRQVFGKPADGNESGISGPDTALAPEYMDFLARPDIMRVGDSGIITARLEELRAWFERTPRLSGPLSALRKRPFILAGGQDLTREIVYLLLKKHGVPNEKIQLIIHFYDKRIN